MITHWTLLMAVMLLAVGPYRALGRPTEPEVQSLRMEEVYSELADEFRQLHNQELRLLQYLAVQAEHQQREEAYLQRQREHREQLHEARNSLLDQGSLLDDIPAEYGPTSGVANGGDGTGTLSAGVVNGRSLSAYGTDLTDQTESLQREIPHQKNKSEKKNNHYMSLCHFKLCNMGRKRNQRFAQLWN
uniref:Putative secreted protein n=1 Tax=Anopheles marajoara TaxID=58244 RepID=A0A2M4C0N5_9DIPT